MSVEAEIFTVLGPLVDNRVYPDTAPLNTPKPYIVYQRIGGRVITPLGRDIPDKQNARVQVTCWSATRLASSALALQIEDLMRTTEVFVACSPESAPVSMNEPDMGLYGAAQDFTVWSQR
jgi:hypothetical protein